jgi:UDP-2-acetamido-3-amino-2,3-dideoxy-glucuronate N-acetyltransferase
VAEWPVNDAPFRLLDGVELGENVTVYSFTNLYGCSIGDETRIGTFVEIQSGAQIGARCKIQSHTFICTGVEIEDDVFVGHGVVFINDKHPRSTTADGSLEGEDDWTLLPTVVERGASIGSGAVILGGIRIGEGAMIGAGAVVTRDVEPRETVVGNPARESTRA